MSWVDHALNEKKICALVVDSHISISEMLSIVLNGERHFHLADEAASGFEGLRLFRKYKPDFVISELELPEMNGVEMLHEMRQENPEVRMLVYSGTTNHALI